MLCTLLIDCNYSSDSFTSLFFPKIFSSTGRNTILVVFALKIVFGNLKSQVGVGFHTNSFCLSVESTLSLNFSMILFFLWLTFSYVAWSSCFRWNSWSMLISSWSGRWKEEMSKVLFISSIGASFLGNSW